MIHRNAQGQITIVERSAFKNDKLYYNCVYALKVVPSVSLVPPIGTAPIKIKRSKTR